MHPLDLDLYKLTMQQMVFHQFYNHHAEFLVMDRGSKEPPIVEAEDIHLCTTPVFETPHLEYLRKIGYFKDDYLDFLTHKPAATTYVRGPDGGVYGGFWRDNILIETRLLGLLSGRHYANSMLKFASEYPYSSIAKIEEDAKLRINQKAAFLENLDVRFMEFGTRRRASLEVQDYAVGKFKEICKKSFIGTSNVYLAEKHGVAPKGTFAHEAVMAMGIIPEGNSLMLRAWEKEYGDFPNLMTALTDTYGSREFFRTYFKQLWYKKYKALRQDSGDPLYYTEILLKLLHMHGLNPAEFILVYSDGLDVSKIERIHRVFGTQINQVFGIGTDISYDNVLADYYGPPKYVIKMWTVNGKLVCKLSDSKGKFTGVPTAIEQALSIFNYLAME